VTDPITARFDGEFTLSGTWLPAQPEEDYFPGIQRPDEHQIEVRDELLSDGSSVVLNTNPTGAGKTLSWAGPTIRSGEHGDGWVVVATYPTNALVADQQEMLQSLFREYYTDPPASIAEEIHLESTEKGRLKLQTQSGSFSLTERVLRVTGEDTLGKSTIAELNDVVENSLKASQAGLPTIILTTPDMFTLVAKQRIPDRDIRGLVMGVDAVVVDEFHLANPRAKRHLPFCLDFYQQRLGDRTLLDNLVFLSATPDETYISQIQRGMETSIVTRESFSEEPRRTARQILPEATLYTKPRPIFSNGQWISDHIDEVVEWIESGENQSLIVVDSVREVETIAEVLIDNTSRSVGKIYGWKREGRQEIVDSSDIVVGNKAVEVGIDFEAVDRILATGYTPSSAIQRIGRMRARDIVDQCEIGLITTPEGHDAVCRSADNGRLSRDAFDEAIHEIRQAAETPYYGVLCALYFEYLWSDAESPLSETVRKQDLPVYKQAVYEHFAEDAEPFGVIPESPEEFWNQLRELRASYYDNNTDLFEEMHTYRSSSLSATIIDENDPDEPLKRYSLHYVLRYGKGEFISENETIEILNDTIEESVTPELQDELHAMENRTVGTFLIRDFRDTPIDVHLSDFQQVSVWQNKCRGRGSEANCHPKFLPSPEIKRRTGGIRGSEYLDLGEEVLAQYAHGDRSEIKSRFGLGPYANIHPVDDSDVILLWQDAILAHASLMTDHVS
jgi:CRISPR-associated helicase Cas3